MINSVLFSFKISNVATLPLRALVSVSRIKLRKVSMLSMLEMPCPILDMTACSVFLASSRLRTFSSNCRVTAEKERLKITISFSPWLSSWTVSGLNKFSKALLFCLEMLMTLTSKARMVMNPIKTPKPIRIMA